MGFGFNIVVIFIFVPLSLLLLVVWSFTRKKLIGKALGLIWVIIFGLIVTSMTVQFLTAKKELEKNDYYGQYIVNRNYFEGKQADWQYESFRFEIKENDSIYFHVTNKEKILKTFYGTVKATDPNQHSSARLIISMDDPTHHIMGNNPTTYRSAWSFNLVFHSNKFNSVYFKKGIWKPID